MFYHSSFDTFLLSRINESKACGNDEYTLILKITIIK